MDIELKQKDNKIQFLEDEIGIPEYKVVEEMKKLDLNKTSIKEKGDRNMNKSKKH